jgi:hypothetical protein
VRRARITPLLQQRRHGPCPILTVSANAPLAVDSDEGLLCDACNQFYHLDCLPPSSEESARRLHDAANAGQPTPDWFCPDCDVGAAGDDDTRSEVGHPPSPMPCDAGAAAAQSQTVPSKVRAYFLYARGGAGKTFLDQIVLDYVRSQGAIALAMSSSGIGALLLQGGRTVHSRLRVPITLKAESTLNFSDNSALANLLRKTTLLLWDEATMMPRQMLEMIDAKLRELMGTDVPFGGKLLLLTGDWRQLLPIARGRPMTVNATHLQSDLWRHFAVLTLTENERIKRRLGPSPTAARRAQLMWWDDFLLALGEGAHELGPAVRDTDGNAMDDARRVIFDASLVCRGDRAAFINRVYPRLEERAFAALSTRGDDAVQTAAMHKWGEYLRDRIVLAPWLDDVTTINDEITAKLPGDVIELLSTDCALDDDAHVWPSEVCNTFDPSGMPPHRLLLKRGSIVMLMRNLKGHERHGLCNGTRLMVLKAARRNLRLMIVTGDKQHLGTVVDLPRIRIDADDGKLPFKLRRIQFPVLPPSRAAFLRSSHPQPLTARTALTPRVPMPKRDRWCPPSPYPSTNRSPKRSRRWGCTSPSPCLHTASCTSPPRASAIPTASASSSNHMRSRERTSTRMHVAGARSTSSIPKSFARRSRRSTSTWPHRATHCRVCMRCARALPLRKGRLRPGALPTRMSMHRWRSSRSLCSPAQIWRTCRRSKLRGRPCTSICLCRTTTAATLTPCLEPLNPPTQIPNRRPPGAVRLFRSASTLTVSTITATLGATTATATTKTASTTSVRLRRTRPVIVPQTLCEAPSRRSGLRMRMKTATLTASPMRSRASTTSPPPRCSPQGFAHPRTTMRKRTCATRCSVVSVWPCCDTCWVASWSDAARRVRSGDQCCVLALCASRASTPDVCRGRVTGPHRPRGAVGFCVRLCTLVARLKSQP